MSGIKKRRRGIKAMRKLAALIVLAVIIYFAYPYAAEYFGIDSGSKNKVVIPVGAGEYIEVHFIDVGQGDSILIMTANGNMLIDAGPGSAEDELKEYLCNLEIHRFEYAVFTHSHEDHIGGADMIMTDFTVSNVIIPDAAAESMTYTRMIDAIESSGANVITAVSGLEYTLGSMTATVIAPNAESYRNTNNYSVVMRLEFGETVFMMTGDAEDVSEAEMLAKYDTQFLDCDVLKVGHHGSQTSSTVEFIKSLTPSISVIFCAEGNSYGHPHALTLTKLTDAGSTIYRTDRLGTVVFVSDGKEVTIKQK